MAVEITPLSVSIKVKGEENMPQNSPMKIGSPKFAAHATIMEDQPNYEKNLIMRSSNFLAMRRIKI